MLPKYYSSWVHILFVLWVFGYIFKIDVITKYINPYYTSILMCIGFCLFIMYTHKLWFAQRKKHHCSILPGPPCLAALLLELAC